MTSELITLDGLTVESEGAHGTVTRHHREYQRVPKGSGDVDEPGRVDLCADAGVLHRANLDGNEELKVFYSCVRWRGRAWRWSMSMGL